MHLSLHRLKLYRKTMDGLLDTALYKHCTTGQEDTELFDHWTIRHSTA